MAYREGLACAVNGLTCTIRAGEKVGVVGRTGAGKSSLVAVLLRMVENGSSQGRVVIDGVDTRLVGLDDLRRRISVIPQVRWCAIQPGTAARQLACPPFDRRVS